MIAAERDHAVVSPRLPTASVSAPGRVAKPSLVSLVRCPMTQPTPIPDGPSEEILRFAADSPRSQTSASFYAKVALTDDYLRHLLELATGETVAPGRVAQVACLVRDASIK